jgi:hypothetical protein
MHRVATIQGWAYVRGLRGEDEESIESVDTASAIALIDRLLVHVPGAAFTPGHAARMSAADRDRLFANVYQRELGRQIASSPACSACGARFDVTFDLTDLVSSLQPDREVRQQQDGSYLTSDGIRFRLPSGVDELEAAATSNPRETLFERCHLDGPRDPEVLAEAMERAAPLLDVEVDTQCPECGQAASMRFDIQSYLLGSLLAERRQRSLEVHRLARAFGWSLTEILSLTRGQRRLHAELSERE